MASITRNPAFNIPAFVEPKNNEKLPKETVHVHGMWYKPSPGDGKCPRPIQDATYGRQVQAAYLAMTRNAGEKAQNVKNHLWLDRKNAYALYMPGEVEIPHSMLAKAPVSIHFKGEIEQLITQVPDDELRKILGELNTHASIENIGLRSDIVRLLYGFLYSEQAMPEAGKLASNGSEGGEVNIHIDTDTKIAMSRKSDNERVLALTLEHKRKNDGHEPAWSLPIKEAKTSNGKQSGRGDAMISMVAMHDAVKRLRYPAKPDPMTREEFQERISQPQKSWSNRAQLNQVDLSPRHLLLSRFNKGGFVTHAKENSLIAMIPKHPDVIEVIKTTHRALNGEDGIGVELHASILKMALEFYEFSCENAPIMQGNEKVIDYFRFSERTLLIAPRLQEKLNALRDTCNDYGIGEKERADARIKGLVIMDLYKNSKSVVKTFVNKNSFFPQKLGSRNQDQKFYFEALAAAVLGTRPEAVREGNWGGGDLEFKVTLEPGDHWRVRRALPDGLKEIKLMLSARELE